VNNGWAAERHGKGKGNAQGKGIVEQSPGGDDVTRDMAWQLQNDTSEAVLDSETKLELVYLELEASPTVSISSDDGIQCTELDSEYD
jgi:hypothetical protein